MEKGLASFKEAVMRDCKQYNDCFNENGCNHEFTRMVPEDNPRLIAMGITQSCRSVSKCSHKYCDKYVWVLERAKHYAEKSGKTFEEILTIWETDRSYWYMNYYQECNQPLLNSGNIIMHDDWIAELKKRFGNNAKNWAFKCPQCGHIQTIQDFIDHKIDEPESKVMFSCIGRYVKNIGCDWTLGGLLKIHTSSVFCNGKVTPVFEMADANYKN